MDFKKKVYGFNIWDNDNSGIDEGNFMLYTLRDNFLKPVLSDFERGFNSLFSFCQMVECLKFNKVNKLFTYHPNICDTLCCAPYEVNTEEEFEYCAFSGKWNRFSHLPISLSQEENEIFNKNNLELIHLNKNDLNQLESILKFYY